MSTTTRVLSWPGAGTRGETSETAGICQIAATPVNPHASMGRAHVRNGDTFDISVTRFISADLCLCLGKTLEDGHLLRDNRVGQILHVRLPPGRQVHADRHHIAFVTYFPFPNPLSTAPLLAYRCYITYRTRSASVAPLQPQYCQDWSWLGKMGEKLDRVAIEGLATKSLWERLVKYFQTDLEPRSDTRSKLDHYWSMITLIDSMQVITYS